MSLRGRFLSIQLPILAVLLFSNCSGEPRLARQTWGALHLLDAAIQDYCIEYPGVPRRIALDRADWNSADVFNWLIAARSPGPIPPGERNPPFLDERSWPLPRNKAGHILDGWGTPLQVQFVVSDRPSVSNVDAGEELCAITGYRIISYGPNRRDDEGKWDDLVIAREFGRR
jgi:hypothetical protein